GDSGGIPLQERLVDRLNEVHERIARACERAGRDPAEVTLVAVTKTVPPDRVSEAIRAGVRHIGENRVQEAREKFPLIEGAGVVRHLIGRLQTNKARYVPGLFDWVHSLDRLELAAELGKRAVKAGKILNCLIQVNVSGEPTKRGVPPGEALALAAAASQVEGVRVRGLMTIGPLTGDADAVRRAFAELRELAGKIAREGLPGVTMEHLSMGMSGDFEAAVEEGATMIRVGSAIFGPRQ